MNIPRTLVILLLGAHGVFAQALRPANPEVAGFVLDRLDRIDRAIQAEIDGGKLPGAVALVARNGSIVYHRSFGYADIASKKPMQNDSIFRIASMSKAVTSVGVMILYEQGRFSLNDPVSSYLPAFHDPKVLVSVDAAGRVTETRAAASEIKIIDLLTHSSGISYPFITSKVQKAYVEAGIIDGATASDTKLKTIMDELASQPLLFDPGTDYAYGLNTDVLGYLIEVVSGRPLDRFLREEIFEPLGMGDTYFYIPAEKADRLVTLYADVDGLRVSEGQESDIKMDDPRYPVAGAKTYFSGGAGLSSTAYDYARFVQMLLNEGELDGRRILGRKSVELMRTARIDRDDDNSPDFGLGFQVIDDIGKLGELGSNGAYSWGGAFYTSYWIDPTEQLIGVLMSQVRPATSDLRARFPTLVYQALE